jgi:hypothetical protein
MANVAGGLDGAFTGDTGRCKCCGFGPGFGFGACGGDTGLPGSRGKTARFCPKKNKIKKSQAEGTQNFVMFRPLSGGMVKTCRYNGSVLAVFRNVSYLGLQLPCAAFSGSGHWAVEDVQNDILPLRIDTNCTLRHLPRSWRRIGYELFRLGLFNEAQILSMLRYAMSFLC